jgi:hypothetical protein
MYLLRQRIEYGVALSKPVARYTGGLYLRIMYLLRQRIKSRVALSKPVARYTQGFSTSGSCSGSDSGSSLEGRSLTQ